MPTLLALTGVERVGDKPLDGWSLALWFGDWSDLPQRMLFSTWNGRVSVRTQTHRLDDQGRLYDMMADPGQTTAINGEQPELAAKLTEAAAKWQRDVIDKSKGQRAKGGMVDPRPIPVGYREFPRTWLPARDGQPNGKVRRSASAPNSSYFVHWSSRDDSLAWQIAVNTAGKYEVEIMYTCPAEDAGSTIELAFQESRLRGKVEPPWDPPLYTNQDTLPRPRAESPMKEFRPLKLGTIRLDKARGPLTLRAIDIPGDEVMHLRSITLTLLE